MIESRANWNENQQLLKSIILKPERFGEAINVCSQLHAVLHEGIVSNSISCTFEDELWHGMTEEAFRKYDSKEEESIAWNIWHITRIEDITMNILICDEGQVINSDNWLSRMNVSICDTGNAMTEDEIIKFSDSINEGALREYRVEVGRKTREKLFKLQPEDMKKKMEKARLARIIEEGGVLEKEESKWLIDFWGNKNVAGILLMPCTRHLLVHLNSSIKLKQRYIKKGK